MKSLHGLYGTRENIYRSTSPRRKRNIISLSWKLVLVLTSLFCLVFYILRSKFDTHPLNQAKPSEVVELNRSSNTIVQIGNAISDNEYRGRNLAEANDYNDVSFLMLGLSKDLPNDAVMREMQIFCDANKRNIIHLIMANEEDIQTILGINRNSNRTCIIASLQNDRIFSESKRVSRLAHLRQFQRQQSFLKFSEDEISSFQAIILADFDLEKFPNYDSIVDASKLIYGNGEEEDETATADVVCANGYDTYGDDKEEEERGYYDTFPLILKKEKFIRTGTLQSKGFNHWAYRDGTPKRNVILFDHFVESKTTSVSSCFGGFALYKPNIWMMSECTYESNDNEELLPYLRLKDSRRTYFTIEEDDDSNLEIKEQQPCNSKDSKKKSSFALQQLHRKTLRTLLKHIDICEHIVFHSCLHKALQDRASDGLQLVVKGDLLVKRQHNTDLKVVNNNQLNSSNNKINQIKSHFIMNL